MEKITNYDLYNDALKMLDEEDTAKAREKEEVDDERIKDFGQTVVGRRQPDIFLISIIGEIEGHEVLGKSCKTTKYEHILPRLVELEEDDRIKGILVLVNTVGGDVTAGLAIAEMIASLSKPTVSLVIGDSHSIGVPLAVATDYSFIVPSGTMIVHPVRMTGLVIGAPQTYEHFKLIQDRIVQFISGHSRIKPDYLEELMLRSGILTKDLGTILVGEGAVKEGLVDEVGGITQALRKLRELISAAG